MKISFLNVFIFIFFTLNHVFAQRTVTHQNQIWMGYMTNIQLNSKYSLWNDVHLVPTGFFLLRTGLTRHIANMNVTIGYGYGRLPVSATNTSLNRVEHRPWGQIQQSFSLPKHFSIIGRFRYDARFRQNIKNDEPTNTWSFINRVRVMATVRKHLTSNETNIGRPFISVSDEILLNYGKHVTYNRFDQNRISLMIGTQYKNFQFQVGYMNRYVKTGDDHFTQNNTLVLWFTHQFNSKTK